MPSINIRIIGELVSSRESFHAAKKVHRSTHSPGTRGLSRDAPQAQREQRESAPRSGSLEGRCGRAGVDRRADRRRLFVPHQDRREHSPTMRAARVRAGAGTKTAGVPPDPETAQRRTGGSHHRPACWGRPPKGYANWSLRLLARRVVELAIIESISHETIRRTLKKTG